MGRYDAFAAHSLLLLRHLKLFEPRAEEIEAHSPWGMLCDTWGMSCEELEMPRSLLFASHSPLFASFELRGMGHEELFERPEGGGTAPEELFAPLAAELAELSLACERREERGMPREEQGMWRERVFEGCGVLFREEEDGGMRLGARIARRLVPTFIDKRRTKAGERTGGPFPGSLLCLGGGDASQLRTGGSSPSAVARSIRCSCSSLRISRMCSAMANSFRASHCFTRRRY